MDAPQEIMRVLFGGRLLERSDLAALRVHRTQDVLDRPVLVSGVQRLGADQERPPPIGIEQSL